MRALAAALWFWPACASAQAGFDVVVLGEVHDNPAHHAEQARIVAEVRPRAIVWEMMRKNDPARIAGVVRADAAALSAALAWEERGWPDFAMYHPIIVAAPSAVHVGADVPRADLRRAMEIGAAAVFGDGAEAWGLGPLAIADQAAREAEQAAAHCDALPPDMLPGMVDAQRLRDAVMARAAATALDAHGGPVVVIAGAGHARTDRGVPAVLRVARPDISVWAIGMTEGGAGPGAPFDAVFAAPPVPRADPCAAFRQGG